MTTCRLLAAVVFGLAMAMTGCAQRPQPIAPSSLTMSTGAAGGTFVEYGDRLAKLMSTATSVTVTTRNSGGSLDNLRCLNEGKCDLALVAMASAYEAWHGLQWTKDKPLRGYSVMLPMYETPFHLATTQASQVTRFEQLAGRKVGVGPKGGANELIFSALGATLNPPPEMVYGTPTEMADGVIRGSITAFFFGAGAPVPAYRDIAERSSIVFLPIAGAALASAQKTFPYLTNTVLPANSYKGQVQPVPTLGLWNFILVRNEIPADVVYALTRSTFVRNDLATVVHPTAVQTKPENLNANTFLPIHPGALRYYKEAGAAP
ncbi:MAG: TAXI family TRAP transporter solute-binding subunit [Burkholderiales bacterium]|nr:TAXI family TRAP transporter solute-binding subunit [Burkholderiales bacterium]